MRCGYAWVPKNRMSSRPEGQRLHRRCRSNHSAYLGRCRAAGSERLTAPRPKLAELSRKAHRPHTCQNPFASPPPRRLLCDINVPAEPPMACAGANKLGIRAVIGRWATSALSIGHVRRLRKLARRLRSAVEVERACSETKKQALHVAALRTPPCKARLLSHHGLNIACGRPSFPRVRE
jgi:hypothetical protein